MCARFVSLESSGMIAEYFGAHGDLDEELRHWPMRYNVAPTQSIRVLAQRAGTDAPTVNVMRWGIVPPWQRTQGPSQPLINARAETAWEKPSFRDAFSRRRCIVPMTGFYEWTPGRPRRQPHLIRPSSMPLLAVAGIWNPPQREFGSSVAILTTAANRDMVQLHDRMPALLDPDSWSDWLNPAVDDTQMLLGMVASIAEGQLQSMPVGTQVNSVRAEGPHLLDPPSASSDDLAAPKAPQLFSDEFGSSL
jgi:putative SOS response-associated peptidase YedK